MLKDLLTESSISVNEPAETKEEAIKKSGTLLLNNGAIQEKYIEAILTNSEKNGSYFVIAPGIAMPHARPEEGVLKNGISIVTLEKPIHFGHKLNDPVKILIGLCAVDNHSHLTALTEMIDILGDDSKKERILKATTIKEILNITKEEI